MILSQQHEIYLKWTLEWISSTIGGRKSCILSFYLWSQILYQSWASRAIVQKIRFSLWSDFMSTKPNPSDMVIGTDTLHHLVQKTKHTQFWPFRTPCFGQILPFLATAYLMIFGPNAHFSCQQN